MSVLHLAALEIDMSSERSILQIGGLCALAGAVTIVAGATVGVVYGLGSLNLPITTREGILELTENRTAYLVREWLYLWYAVLEIGVGIGLFVLVKKRRSLAVWAFAAWTVGLLIGIIEDSLVVAAVECFARDFAAASVSSQDAWVVVGRVTDGAIRTQQAVSLLLGTGLGLALFAWGIWTTEVASKWLAVVGLGAAALAGVLFPIANVLAPDGQFALLGENGFVLGIVWDVWCGIVLLRAGAATNADAE